MNIYCVYDKLAEECGPLFEQKTDATAMRAYRRLFQESQDNKAEYKLLCLGEIDKQTAKIKIYDMPKEVYVPEIKEEID